MNSCRPPPPTSVPATSPWPSPPPSPPPPSPATTPPRSLPKSATKCSPPTARTTQKLLCSVPVKVLLRLGGGLFGGFAVLGGGMRSADGVLEVGEGFGPGGVESGDLAEVVPHLGARGVRVAGGVLVGTGQDVAEG